MTNAIFFARKKYLTNLWTSCSVRVAFSQLHAYVRLTPLASRLRLTQNLLAVDRSHLVAFALRLNLLRSHHDFYSSPFPTNYPDLHPFIIWSLCAASGTLRRRGLLSLMTS